MISWRVEKLSQREKLNLSLKKIFFWPINKIDVHLNFWLDEAVETEFIEL